MKHLTLLFLLLTFQISNSQAIAAFSGTSTPSVATVSDISASALSRGPGITAAGGTTFNSSSWTTRTIIDLTDYIEWTITADNDFSITVTSIDINYDRDALFIFGSGPQELVIRTSLDGYTSNIFSDTSVDINGETASFATSQISSYGGSITYRLYGFNSETGIFGLNFGSFDIEGGLGTVLGLANTGIAISGTVNYDGLFYNGTSWTPYEPDGSTGSENAIVGSGTYTITSDAIVNDLEIRSTSTLTIDKADSITINGDLTVDGTLELDSDSNEYSSLIVDGTVSGNVVYKRHINNTAAVGEEDANDLIAPPVSGEAFNNFLSNNSNIVSNSTNTLYLFGPFNKTTGTYDIYSNTETATLDAGNGYRAASTDAGTFTFTGTVNTGTITKSISNSGPTSEEWNLIGNPYPSFIKLSDFLSSNNTQFDSSSAGVYGYDGDASDGWAIWNQAYSDNNPNALITPGQGFMVASKTGGGTITFNSGMRSVGNTDDFILGRSPNVVTSSHFKLLLTNESKSYATDFYFNPNASLGLDSGYDASIFENSAPSFSIYSHLIENNQGIPMAIQSLGENDLTNVTIPLGVNTNQGEQINFSISESNLPNTTEVYLEDTQTNTSTLLNAGNYTLTPNSNLNGTGRFYLNVTNGTLSTPQETLDKVSIYNNHNDKSIVIVGQLIENTTIKIYDIQGRIVNSSILQTSNKKQIIDVNNISTGVYLVQLGNENLNITQKVILR